MIVFDTNVISEIVKDDCAPQVAQWLTTVRPEDMATTAVSLAELFSGTSIMPDGKRKRDLQHATNIYLNIAFGTRILEFDANSAIHFAFVFASLRAKGEAIGFADCQIAAIARQHNFSVATRDVNPFRFAGLDVINPWDL